MSEALYYLEYPTPLASRVSNPFMAPTPSWRGEPTPLARVSHLGCLLDYPGLAERVGRWGAPEPPAKKGNIKLASGSGWVAGALERSQCNT
jgi:hypothetical protein